MHDTAIIIFTYQRIISSINILDALVGIGKSVFVFHDYSGSKSNLILKEKLLKYDYINLIVRNKNFGLKNNLISGITEVCKNHKRFIVIEDDLVVNKSLIKQFIKVLKKHENDESLFEVSSFPFIGNNNRNYPIKLPVGTSWLWGSWPNRWTLFMNFIEKPISLSILEKAKLDFYFRYPFSYLYYLEQKDSISSWAIYKHIFMYKNNYKCLYFNSGMFSFQDDISSSSTHGENNFEISKFNTDWKKNLVYLSKQNRFINFLKFVKSCLK